MDLHKIMDTREIRRAFAKMSDGKKRQTGSLPEKNGCPKTADANRETKR